MQKALLPALCLTSLFALAPDAAGQDRVPLTRLQGTIVVDGNVDEAAWEDIEPLDVVMYQPTFMGEMTEDTEIRVAYDDDYVYVSGRLFDSDPEGVRSYSLYRDRYSGDDTFAIILDTFNDNENALWFYTTPEGIRLDMAISNDGNSGGGGGSANSSWNTYWDASARINDDGWSAEIRIPFSSLGFQTIGGDVTMGLAVYRFIARKNERHIYPHIPPNWDRGFAKPSQAQDVMLQNVVAQRPIYVTPYIAGGADRRAELRDDASGYRHRNSFQREAGIDVKFNVNSTLTLDATVNTDFAQVEADDQQVNLTRFSLFFPEKRQFFQERAGVFEFSLGGRDRLFHSRQIGVADGELVRILGGARLVGRVGQWDLGAINMQTARTSELNLPSENFGVLRARRQVINANSFLGAMLTTRVGTDGSYNYGYGIDGIFKVGANDFVTIQTAQTLDGEYESQGFDFVESSQFRFVWERVTSDGLFYDLTVKRVGSRFDPGVGFNRRTGISSPFFEIGYGKLSSPDSPVQRVTTKLKGSASLRNEDRAPDSGEAGVEVEVEMKSGSSLTLETGATYEDLRDSLTFSSSASVPPGEYRFPGASLQYRSARSSALRLSTELNAGHFFDGTRLALAVSPTLAVSKHLEVEAKWETNIIKFADRGEEFTFHLFGAKLQFALNKKLSADLFLQYNTAADFATTNVRFRYNFGEGSDLWLVVTEGTNRDRERQLPVLPVSSSRTGVLKYTYTFRR